MAILQLFKTPSGTEDFTIDDDRVVLGRHPDCDIVLDAASVSRQHAQIVRDAGQFFIEDLHSRNGTFVNGQLIQGRHSLQDGDRLKICDLSLAFYIYSAQRQAAWRHRPVRLLAGDDGRRRPAVGTSTIMSKLDVGTSRSGVRLHSEP